MSRIAQVAPETATGKAEQLYAGIRRQLGVVPNLYQTIAVQPRTLEAVLQFGAGAPTLSNTEKQYIAVAVAETNGCEYCLAAHTLIGTSTGIPAAALIEARRGHASDAKHAALLAFTNEIVAKKGVVSDESYAAFIAAGYTEAQVPEVVLSVAQNIFTNYFNNLNRTTLDFPPAPAL